MPIHNSMSKGNSGNAKRSVLLLLERGTAKTSVVLEASEPIGRLFPVARSLARAGQLSSRLCRFSHQLRFSQEQARFWFELGRAQYPCSTGFARDQSRSVLIKNLRLVTTTRTNRGTTVDTMLQASKIRPHCVHMSSSHLVPIEVHKCSDYQ